MKEDSLICPNCLSYRQKKSALVEEKASGLYTIFCCPTCQSRYRPEALTCPTCLRQYTTLFNNPCNYDAYCRDCVTLDDFKLCRYFYSGGCIIGIKSEECKNGLLLTKTNTEYPYRGEYCISYADIPITYLPLKRFKFVKMGYDIPYDKLLEIVDRNNNIPTGTFAFDAVVRDNHWTCACCHQEFHVSDMDWAEDNFITPTCPNCGTMDMMIEQREV